jgi:hypothetical protein
MAGSAGWNEIPAQRDDRASAPGFRCISPASGGGCGHATRSSPYFGSVQRASLRRTSLFLSFTYCGSPLA